jgi:23S rRNA (uridine2552-2'-O)-methyltransferase
MQVAAEIVGARGRVVGVDVAVIDPPLGLENTIALEADLFDSETPGRILSELGGRAAVVLCDAAPKLTGIRERDRATEENLLVAVEDIIPLLIQTDGSILVKLLECPEAAAFERRVRKLFSRAQAAKTKATRKGSSERYLLARGFRPPATSAPGDPVE